MGTTAPNDAQTPDAPADQVSRLAASIADAANEWKQDKKGRYYIPRVEGAGGGMIWRKGDETVDEARARDTERSQHKKRSDPKPGGKHAAKSGPPKATTAELESFLAELLVMPAIPVKTLLGCDYCMHHFLTQGPLAAHQIAELSTDNPALRRLLERMYVSWTSLTYGAVLAAYIGKPLLHHAAPAPVLEAAGPFLGVPPRAPTRETQHEHVRYKGPNTAPYAATETDSPTRANGTAT
jgi:hypothetical protein